MKKDRAQSAMELTTKADKKQLQRAWLDKLSTAISKENEANRKLRKDIDEIRSNIEKASSVAGRWKISIENERERVENKKKVGQESLRKEK